MHGGKASDVPPTDQSEVPKGAASGSGKGQVQGKQAAITTRKQAKDPG